MQDLRINVRWDGTSYRSEQLPGYIFTPITSLDVSVEGPDLDRPEVIVIDELARYVAKKVFERIHPGLEFPEATGSE